MGEDSRPPARGQGCPLPWAGLLEQTNGLKKAPSPAQVTKHSLIPVQVMDWEGPLSGEELGQDK